MKNKTIIDVLKGNASMAPALRTKKSQNKIVNINMNSVWESVSYNTYFRKVKGFAESLNYWFGSNTVVAIYGTNSVGWYYAYLGTIMNSGVTTAIPLNRASSICEYILEDSGATVLVIEGNKQLEHLKQFALPSSIKLIVYYANIDKKYTNATFKTPLIDIDSFMKKRKRIKKSAKLDYDAVYLYSYKNVNRITYTNKDMMKFVEGFLNDVKNNGSVKIISYLPLCNVVTQIFQIYLPICCCGETWFAKNYNSVLGIKPTVFMATPEIWKEYMKKIKNYMYITRKMLYMKIKRDLGFGKCNLFMSTGAKLEDNVKKFFKDLDINISDIYYGSECGIVVDLKEQLRKSIKIKLRNNEILLKDKQHSDWMETGDVGYVDNDKLCITVDKHDLMKINGKLVCVKTIEQEI